MGYLIFIAGLIVGICLIALFANWAVKQIFNRR